MGAFRHSTAGGGAGRYTLRRFVSPSLRLFRPAFSLAELMIALVVLGLGLLFIAAALPAGIDYARRNAALADGEATAIQALNTLGVYVRTSRTIINDIDPKKWLRLDSIVRPRAPSPTNANVFVLTTDPSLIAAPFPIDWEPIIKVRPFVVRNVGAAGDRRGWHVVDDTEAVVARYLNDVLTVPPNPLETDTAPFLRDLPLCPATARFFPAIEPAKSLRVEDFFRNRDAYPTLGPRPDNADLDPPDGPPDQTGNVGVARQELEKCFGRRIAWTAFYRRVSYPKWTGGSDDLGFASGDPNEVPIPGTGDPLLYEIIVVVTLRPTEQHRFPMQDLTAGGGVTPFLEPQAIAPGSGADNPQTGADRLAPTPWLVVFKKLIPKVLRGMGTSGGDPIIGNEATGERVLNTVGAFGVAERPRLELKCEAELGRVLPVGSRIIPARNDNPPPALILAGGPIEPGQQGRCGFTPSAPDQVAIFTVIDRPDEQTVVVESDGFLPWLRKGADEEEFPFWIIPPTFVERGSDDQPLYENRSPILQVLRQTVRLPEQ